MYKVSKLIGLSRTVVKPALVIRSEIASLALGNNLFGQVKILKILIIYTNDKNATAYSTYKNTIITNSFKRIS